ncbi:MAG: AMP-binding protein [Oscillospiraceae bacterium]|nr:AMP-binding protein [Oscillospiraceae bacterium]
MKRQNKNYLYYDTRRVSSFRELLKGCRELYGDKTLFIFKKNGEIIQKSHNEFSHDVDCFGTALMSLGLGERHVALLSENSYEWLVTYFTVIASNGVFVPIDRDLTPEGVANILKIGDVSMLVISSALAVKMKSVISDNSYIKDVIIIGKNDDPSFASFEALIEKGDSLLKAGDKSYTSLATDNEVLSSLVYTSGTTGIAKGVMLSEYNIVSTAINALNSMHIHDSCLSVLPYHHTFEATTGILCYMHMGRVIYINENLRALAVNMKNYKPCDMQCVPLVVESIYKRIWATAEEGHKDKILKTLMNASRGLMKIGVDMRKTLFKSIHDSLGGNFTRFICGGAAVKPHICEFFEDIGIEVLTGYGITECSPLVCVNRDYFYDAYSCGVPIRNCSIKINNPNENGEGEICVKGDNVMLGYYKNPVATAAAFEDGWFLTGDIGKIDELGRLFITGRKKNVIVLKNGKNVYPEELESYFDESPYISEIIVFPVTDADNAESMITAEVFPNQDKSAEYGKEKLEKLIRQEIDTVNSGLPMYKQIKRVQFRNQEFEKTTTRKIKRFAVVNGKN